MNLYDELFPEDSHEGEEKTASRAMDYFGIRFEDRVEKLAGVKEMYEGARAGLSSFGKGFGVAHKGRHGVAKHVVEKLKDKASRSEALGAAARMYGLPIAGAVGLAGGGYALGRSGKKKKK